MARDRTEIAPERLREIREALLFGEPLDGDARLELVAAIEYLVATLPASRGRPVDAALRRRAGIVGVLHERHGMKLELALNIVARVEGTEDARRRDRDALRAAYRRLRAGGGRVVVSERAVAAALAAAAKRAE